MEQTKQHPLCRMKQGWCRDCQVDSGSSLYKEVCLISQASDLLAKVSEQEKEIAELKEENTRLGDTVVSLGKVLLKPNEREQFENQVSEQQREIDKLEKEIWELKRWSVHQELSEQSQRIQFLESGLKELDVFLQTASMPLNRTQLMIMVGNILSPKP